LPAAQVLGEEALDRPVHVDHVLIVDETVPFIAFDYVLDFDPTCA
jgi:hypothetical protein